MTSTGRRTDAQQRNASALFVLVATGIGAVALLAPAILAARFIFRGFVPSQSALTIAIAVGVTGLASLIGAALERRKMKLNSDE